MSASLTFSRNLWIAKLSVISYLLIFQSWRIFADYPEGVLKEYSAVGIFHFLPGPLSDKTLDIIFYLWPVFLMGALIPRFAKLSLIMSFILGCYVLGYAYNFGRIFHGTSLILQVLLVLAVGWSSAKMTPAEKESRAYLVLRTGQLIICLAYFSSGLLKLWKNGWAWALSENLAVILHTQPLKTPLQEFLLGLPSAVLQTLALTILVLEVTSLVPWFFPRWSLVYIAGWTVFHVGVLFAFGGHTTFLSNLALYPFFLCSIFPAKRPT